MADHSHGKGFACFVPLIAGACAAGVLLRRKYAKEDVDSAASSSSIDAPKIGLTSSPPADSKERCANLMQELQQSIVDGLRECDPSATFKDDPWGNDATGARKRGRTCVFDGGEVFEKAGVAFSEVHGLQVPPTIGGRYPGFKATGYFVTGVSLVLHPLNPNVPTVHMNCRYFELAGENESIFWFGGGTDLTPYVNHPEDFKHFHRTLKVACDTHHTAFYPVFKSWCDEYFLIKHREEHRGIGGIFFDYQGNQPNTSLYMGPHQEGVAGQRASGLGKAGKQKYDWERLFAFVQSVGKSFLPSYLPIVQKRRNESYTDEQRSWQMYRRGRYVEFNLVYDRGTTFGLQTGGRIESILMSMPPLTRWEYCYEPKEDEKVLLGALKHPKEWAE